MTEKSETFDERLLHLQPLETFDPTAFVGDDKCPQSVCNFVLALAVAYNDFRDLVLAHELLKLVAPEIPDEISIRRGMVTGITSHVYRKIAGFLHELSMLIVENRGVLEDEAFVRLVKCLPKPAREAWQSVVSAAVSSGPKGDPFGRLMFFARNKVAFHYDAKQIWSGYKSLFLEEKLMEPYVSRGVSMAGTRFYFADAAADYYMRNAADASTVETFITAGSPLFLQVTHALREIPMLFVNQRCSWRTA